MGKETANARPRFISRVAILSRPAPELDTVDRFPRDLRVTTEPRTDWERAQESAAGGSWAVHSGNDAFIIVPFEEKSNQRALQRDSSSPFPGDAFPGVIVESIAIDT